MTAAGTGSPQTMSIPLDLIRENYGNGQYGFRLGINVGVNGGTPEEYMFDTGSDSFNIDVGTGASPAWFPKTGAAKSSPYPYLYGDGTYGYWQQDTTVGSIQFYDSSTGAKVVGYDTTSGLPVAIATDWIVTKNNVYYGGDTLGNAVVTVPGIGTLYQDKTWQQSLDAGQAPEEGIFYGTFGAGDFGNGVPGMLTKTGYIVEANGKGATPGNCSQACVILGLTPALRAQFLSVVPWYGATGTTFPLTGAPSANEFDTAFEYTLTDGKRHSVSDALLTLLDTGTPNIMISDPDVLSAEQQAGNVNASGDLVPGITLASQGLVVTANGLELVGQPDTVVSGSDTTGNYSNVITVGNTAFGYAAIQGIGFFMRNAVMYDLQNQATGFTPFFVTAAPITTGFTAGKASGPLGLAGVISGSGDFNLTQGGIVDMSGTNTYTGATNIAAGAWLGVAGPGSIADSSGVNAGGIFDISRAWQPISIQSLSGSGTVALGAGVLDLTRADGSFTGAIADGGLGGGSGGRLLVSAGRETLSGANTYTGLTGIAAPATLVLSGSLAGGVANLGMLVLVNGSIGGSVVSDHLMGGNGTLGSDLTVSGTIAPGGSGGKDYTLHVAGNYQQAADTQYLVQLNPGNRSVISRVDVTGHATLGTGAQVSVVLPTGNAPFQLGHRYTVFNAVQGVSGQFSLTGNSAISAVLGLSLSRDADDTYLSVVQQRLLTDVTGSSNQTGVLGGIQAMGAGKSVFAAVASLPNDQAIRRAADALSGEIHASLRGALVQQSLYLRDAVDTRLRQSGQGLIGPEQKPEDDGIDFWGQAISSIGYHDGNADVARQTHVTRGFLIGGDHAIASHARLGFSFLADKTALHVKARDSQANSQNYALGVYAGAQFGHVQLRGGAAYATHDISTSRIVFVPNLVGGVQSRQSTDSTQLFVTAAYRFDAGDTAISPFVRGARIRLAGADFVEHGSDQAGLHGHADALSATQAAAGIHVSTRFPLSKGALTLHEVLGRQRVLNHIGTGYTMAFNEGGTAFTVTGLPLVRSATIAGIGLTWKTGNNFSLDLSCQGRFQSGAPDREAGLRLDWWF